MSHYAEVIDGIVTRVLVMDNALTDAESLAWLKDNVANTTWIQCSYNGNIRGVYPGIGYTYDNALDVFAYPVSD